MLEKSASLKKYAIFGLLALAIFETTLRSPLISNALRPAIAALFLAYGIYALLLFRRPSIAAPSKSTKQEPAQNTAARTSSNLWLNAASVSLRATYQLLFRTVFILCALAYLAQAAGLYDDTILAQSSERGYVSYLIAMLNQTIPPIADLVQFIFLDAKPVIWNPENSVPLLLRIASYTVYVFVIGSVVREVWSLARSGQFGEINERDKYAATKGE